MKTIRDNGNFLIHENKIIIIRDITAIISLIIIILFSSYYYQNAFNYETHIYGYYTFALIISIIAFVYTTISIFCVKYISDYADLLLIPGILFLLYSLNNGNEYAIVFGSVFIFFLIIKSVSFTSLKYAIYLITIIYIMQCVTTLYGYVNDVDNINIYNNTGIFSIYCIVFIPTCYYIASKHFCGKNLYIIFGIYLFIILSIIITLKSRTAIITLFIVFIVPYLIKWVNRQQVRGRIVIIILLILLISFGTYYLFHLKQGSSFGRILMIDVSYKHIKEYFWTGIGLGNFTFYYPNWQSYFFNTTLNPNKGYFLNAGETYVIFNEFLQLFISIGAIVFSFISFCIIRFFLSKNEHKLFTLIKITFLIILSCSLTYYTLHINIVLILIAFYSALSFKILFLDRRAQSKEIYLLRSINILTTLLAVYVLYNVYEKYKAINNWSIIKNSYEKIDNIDRRLGLIENQLQNDGKFLADYGNYLYEHQSNVKSAVYYIEKSHNSFINLESKETLAYLYLEQKSYMKAIHAFEWLVNYIPNKFRYRLDLIELYIATNNREKALQLANSTLNMPVKIQSKEVDNIKYKIISIKNNID
ncbi:O-antigen ligase family protein [Sphingobacterium faecium]|uniref:O-antigen ligase family protein n=1 Tax=Sphingobacterium faecium TaxID=34087 RepID=UPI003209BAD5